MTDHLQGVVVQPNMMLPKQLQGILIILYLYKYNQAPLSTIIIAVVTR